jgi:tripartite ATP-independent transporter DctM subunit
MIEMSPEFMTLVMLGAIMLFVITGFPLGPAIGALALIIGGVTLGFDVAAEIIYAQSYALITSYVVIALPLFIFMGILLENSGIVEKLYDALYVWFGGLRGGLAVVTIMIGTVLAACVGVIAASISLLALVTLPSMIKRGYAKDLASGTVCAGGTLGILIPPSIMLVIYGPLAQISIGKLLMGAFFPGLLLAALYIAYILLRCFFDPKAGPAIPVEERHVPFVKKTGMLAYSLGPPAFIILSVLGVIFFGIAPPTEAAATGSLASVLLVIGYRKFSFELLEKVAVDTMKITSLSMLVGALCVGFAGIFMRLGCAEVVTNLIIGMPYGKWGAFIFIQFVIFILGFLIDWIGIIFIVIPIITPMVPRLGFDPLWFAIMTCVNFQTSFMTPPMAFAIFFLKGAADPKLGITTMDIIRGVAPFVICILIGLALCICFPEIITWLPSKMIKPF